MTTATTDTPASLDTPEARERSVSRVLEGRSGLRVEARFDDGVGAGHEIASCPVAGGRYLYDSSESWGLRALGFCRVDDIKHMKALVGDYAARCSEEVAPLCRPLWLSDVLRRRGADQDERGCDNGDG